MSESGKVDMSNSSTRARAPEPLTEEERALLAEYPWPRTEVDRAMGKLLALHDHLQARVKELETDLERALRMAENRLSR